MDALSEYTCTSASQESAHSIEDIPVDLLKQEAGLAAAHIAKGFTEIKENIDPDFSSPAFSAGPSFDLHVSRPAFRTPLGELKLVTNRTLRSTRNMGGLKENAKKLR